MGIRPTSPYTENRFAVLSQDILSADELWLYIFSKLDSRQGFLASRQVSRQFKRLMGDEIILKLASYKLFPDASLPALFPSPPTSDGCWRVFRNQCRFPVHVEEGVCSIQTFGDESRGNCSKALVDGRIVLAQGSKIVIWDRQTGKRQILEGHEGKVSCVEVVDNIIFSGSEDNTVRMWDPKTGAFLGVLGTHEGGVDCLIGRYGKIASACGDDGIKVWNISDIRSESTEFQPCPPCLTLSLDGFGAAEVTLAWVNPSQLASVDESGVIDLWNVEKNADGVFDRHVGNATVIDLGNGGDQELLNIWASRDGKKIFSEWTVDNEDEGSRVVTWDLTTDEITDSIERPLLVDGQQARKDTGGVRQVYLLGGMYAVVGGYESGYIYVVRLERGEVTKHTPLMWHSEDLIGLDELDYYKVLASFKDGKTVVFDFKANHEDIFRGIADGLNQEEEKAIEMTRRRLNRMPESALEQIRNSTPSGRRLLAKMSSEELQEAILRYLARPS